MSLFIKYFSIQIIISCIVYVLFDTFSLYPAIYGKEDLNMFYYIINVLLFILLLMGIPYSAISCIVISNLIENFYLLGIIMISIITLYLYSIDWLFFKCSNFCNLSNDWIRNIITTFLFYTYYTSFRKNS